jgi:hypothetical protein
VLIEKPKPVVQSATEVAPTLIMTLPDQVDRAAPADQSVPGEALPEVTPAREVVAKYPMPAYQLGLSLERRHGTAPNIAGVLAATHNVRVPLRSLGLTAGGDGAGSEMAALEDLEERGHMHYVDLGAQVGVMLAMEYTAGSRSHRLSNGSFGYVQPFKGDSGIGGGDSTRAMLSSRGSTALSM